MGKVVKQRPLLMIIGAGIDQMPAYTEAHNLGVDTLAVDYDPEAPAFEVATYKLVISTKDINAVVAAAREFHQTRAPINGVITLGAEVSQTVSAVATELDLIAVSNETAFLTTNKCARAEVFVKAGVNFPQFISGNKVSDFAHAKFPAIIKPSDNSASRGVRVVSSEKELADYFEVAKSFASDGGVILEEFISGDQISIEGIVVDGRLQVTAIADRNYSRNDEFYPFMIEDGGEMPSRHPKALLDDVKLEFEKAVASLGIHLGPTKGDIIITPSGKVYVIEVTSRLSGGGFCSRVVPMTTGVNIVRPTIQQALGLPVNYSDLQQKFEKGMCHRFFFHNPGRVESISGLNELHSLPDVKESVILREVQIGDILEPITYANRIFYVITIADSREKAVEKATNAIASVTLKTSSEG